MTEDEILSALKPCPFCGAGDIDVRIKARPPRMEGPGEVVAVYINHWCTVRSGATDLHLVVTGRDAPSAISQWNARAT